MAIKYKEYLINKWYYLKKIGVKELDEKVILMIKSQL